MAEMKLEIPQDVVLSIVKAQVIAALGKSEQLVAGVVEAAFGTKENSYDRDTIFERQVTKMINDVAVECFKEWLQEKRADIRSEMRRQLTAKKGELLTSLVDSFTKDLVNIHTSVRLGFKQR